uniref:Dynein regulatory complex protein 1/2 N-terminal domain-containing protein n=1 Tax=Anopheles epiroticus TaxID=199890 RepID=A0A182PMT4_9DIPT
MDNADQETDTKQEELRRKKQEKLLAKNAAAREAQNQLYRDHLKREYGFSDQTEQTFFADWEALCEKVQSGQLAEELRAQQQCFGTTFDRKNECIRRLVGVRDEVQEVHTKCLARLGSVIDYFIRLKDYLTATMLERYEAESQKLLKEFREEVESKESFSDAQTELLEASLAELMSKMRQDELADREWLLEANNLNISAQVEKCEIIRDKKFTEMSALYRQLRATLDDYFQTVLSPERKQTYDRLVYYTELEQQGIDERNCQLAVLQFKKAQLDHSLTLARIGGRRKLRTRNNYRRLLEMKLQLLKQQQKQQDDEHQRCMKWICSFTHHLSKLLTEHLAWGEKIAKQALICTQYETEQDQRYAAKWFRAEPDENQDVPEHDSTFDFLLHKINRIEAINIVLREEKLLLQRENEELQTKFKAYCGLHKVTEPEKLRLCGREAVDPKAPLP